MSQMPTPIKYELKTGEVRWRIRFRTASNKSTDKSGFRTKGAAVAWWQANGPLIQNGVLEGASGGKTRMEDLIDAYVANSAGFAPATVARKESHAKNHVRPYWQGWRVANVTKREVERWIAEMIKKDVGASTIKKCHEMLVTVLGLAMEDGLIARNPARGVRLPKEAPKSHPYLTFEELQELVDTIDQRFRTLTVLLSFTGLRIGEASGLKRKHVDFERRRLLVIDANSVTNGKVHEGATKNNRIRSVPFSEMLEPLLRSAVEGKGQDGLVFEMAEGGPIRHDLWRKRYFHPAIKKINAARRAEAEATGQTFQSFPKITPHDLRHTTASVAAKSGASVKSIQKILGHSSAKITIDTYIDLFESDVDDVIDSVAELAANANFRA